MEERTPLHQYDRIQSKKDSTIYRIVQVRKYQSTGEYHYLAVDGKGWHIVVLEQDLVRWNVECMKLGPANMESHGWSEIHTYHK